MIVHPLLRVRRDVTGALRASSRGRGRSSRGSGGTGPPSSAGLGGGRPPEITESWTHVELAPSKDRVDPDELAADLRHVLDDVRVAVEDQQRMGEVARRLADGLDRRSSRDQRRGRVR